MSVIREHLTSIHHDPEWVDAYISFIENTPEPTGKYDCHHILMSSVFPQFKSLAKSPWNEKKLSYADHLIAHYLLRRATPCSSTAAAFRLMVGLHYNELVASRYDADLLAEIAADYQLAHQEIDPPTAGRIHIYREDERMTCLPEDLSKAEEDGWTTTYPEQQWIFRGDEEKRVLKSNVAEYLSNGWEEGRTLKHTESSREQMRVRHIEQHRKRAGIPDAYSYMPRGEAHHAFGKERPIEIREKIAQKLQGRKLTEEHIEARRKSMLGKHWEWTPEARARRSTSMQGPLHPNWGKSSGALGHVHSEETRAQMSATHKRR